MTDTNNSNIGNTNNNESATKASPKVPASIVNESGWEQREVKRTVRTRIRGQKADVNLEVTPLKYWAPLPQAIAEAAAEGTIAAFISERVDEGLRALAALGRPTGTFNMEPSTGRSKKKVMIEYASEAEAKAAIGFEPFYNLMPGDWSAYQALLADVGGEDVRAAQDVILAAWVDSMANEDGTLPQQAQATKLVLAYLAAESKAHVPYDPGLLASTLRAPIWAGQHYNPERGLRLAQWWQDSANLALFLEGTQPETGAETRAKASLVRALTVQAGTADTAQAIALDF